VVSTSYVENAAAAHVQAAAALGPGSPPAGRAYFINEAQPVNLWNWINELLARAGLPPVRKSIPAWAAYAAGGLSELIYAALRLPGEPPMTRFVAQQLAGSHDYDTSAAQRDFGYRPIVTVEEGLHRLEPELRNLAREG
jgi:nucleoside-diphosphate-sugar epimerase